MQKVRISIPNFLPPGLQAFRSSLRLVSLVFGHSESTKLNSIRKVLDGKVRNFSPTKISSFTVHQYDSFWLVGARLTLRFI